MIKAPSKHGLERKFKPWRRGKSQKANKRSSLKQQLRGHERLLSKLIAKEEGKNGDSDNKKNNDNKEDIAKRRLELETKIKELKLEISQKQQSLTEKKNAEKSHGFRFLDRQRLTRMEKKIKAKLSKDKKNKDLEKELYKIALDQVYVAHHPTDVKYMSLFTRGQERMIDQSRQLYRRAVTRKRILKELATTKKNNTNTTWIAPDMYQRLSSFLSSNNNDKNNSSKEWTIQDEEQTFGGSITRKGIQEQKQKVSNDSRFQVLPSSQHEAVLKAAEAMEKELDQQEQQNASDESSSSSSSSASSSKNDDDDNDNEDVSSPSKPSQPTKSMTNQEKVSLGGKLDTHSDSDNDTSSSSDDDNNDDDDDDDDADPLKRESNNKNEKSTNAKQQTTKKNDDDGSSSSSSSSSDSSDEEDNENHQETADTKNPATKNNQIDSEGDSSSSSSNSSDSDSDSDSSDDDDDDDKQNKKKRKMESTIQSNDKNKNLQLQQEERIANDKNDSDDDDDFFMDADDDDDNEQQDTTNVFEKTKKQIPALNEARGDKSKGWATQRQRPGQFKKKRVRR